MLHDALTPILTSPTFFFFFFLARDDPCIHKLAYFLFIESHMA